MTTTAIFSDPGKQTGYSRMLHRMDRQRYALARALYAVERAGSFERFDDMPDWDIAPIYIILATNLIENKANRLVIMGLLEGYCD